jgi:hypothetical protein
MKKVALFSLLLAIGFFGSQWLPPVLGRAYEPVSHAIRLLTPGSDPHSDDAREGHQEGPEIPTEQKVSTIISALFMLLVGLNMPPIFDHASGETLMSAASTPTIPAAQPPLEWGPILLHVVLVTLLANLGKMVPAFCYRQEAHSRERLALAISMWPRGEVGAGILVISLSYSIGGPIVTVAMLSLALNLLLTGLFILAVKKLMQAVPVMSMYPYVLEHPEAAHAKIK